MLGRGPVTDDLDTWGPASLEPQLRLFVACARVHYASTGEWLPGSQSAAREVLRRGWATLDEASTEEPRRVVVTVVGGKLAVDE